MPQFDFTTWASQIFWLAIAFSAMYVLMSALVLPRMQSISQRREQKITGNLKRAEELQIEAQSILEEYTKAVEDARRDAVAVIVNATANAEQEQAERLNEFKQKTDKATDLALNAIEKSKLDALQEIDEVAVEVAGSVFEKITGNKVADTQIKSALKLVK